MFMVLLCFNFIYGIDGVPNLCVWKHLHVWVLIGDSWSCPHITV